MSTKKQVDEKLPRYRSHTCGDLRQSHIGMTVRLAGWMHSVRDHGGILFLDLRDHYGITQVVMHPENDYFEEFESCHLETVISVTGKVVERSEETRNPRIATGNIEVEVEHLEVLSKAKPLPFPVNQEMPCDENLRLQHRFIDLRREAMHNQIMLRNKVIAKVREKLTGMGFSEFQTPILTSSSPEGARDFLVPSRLHPGRFYALPQAPQIYKQLLMVAGFDRYFQIAPCFRDEDARADRSPGEFYQIDIEMSFVTQEDVFAALEVLMHDIFTEFSDKHVTDKPFPRITYRDAMLRYGTDKPDLRNPLQFFDATETFRGCEFKAFAKVVEKKGVVRALPVRQIADKPRKFFDSLIEFTQSCGGHGLAYLVWTDAEIRSPIAKFLSPEILKKLQDAGNMQPGDVMFFIADKAEKATQIGAEVRQHLGKILDLMDENRFELCWIVDYPMFEHNKEKDCIDFSHNPFSMPQGGLEALESQDPLDVLAHQYDLVCNGIELSSGAIRNHRCDIMVKAFEIAGYSREELETRFSGLFRAFQFGAPPHGGIAPGLDRIIMLLSGVPNIREVIAFPLNQSAQDPLLGAPGEVNEKQLRELHIRTAVPKAKRSQPK